jgi:hypothetical protein
MDGAGVKAQTLLASRAMLTISMKRTVPLSP